MWFAPSIACTSRLRSLVVHVFMHVSTSLPFALSLCSSVFLACMPHTSRRLPVHVLRIFDRMWFAPSIACALRLRSHVVHVSMHVSTSLQSHCLSARASSSRAYLTPLCVFCACASHLRSHVVRTFYRMCFASSIACGPRLHACFHVSANRMSVCLCQSHVCRRECLHRVFT